MKEPKTLQLTAYEYKCWDDWRYKGRMSPGPFAAAVTRARNKMRRLGLPERLTTADDLHRLDARIAEVEEQL